MPTAADKGGEPRRYLAKNLKKEKRKKEDKRECVGGSGWAGMVVLVVLVVQWLTLVRQRKNRKMGPTSFHPGEYAPTPQANALKLPSECSSCAVWALAQGYFCTGPQGG